MTTASSCAEPKRLRSYDERCAARYGGAGDLGGATRHARRGAEYDAPATARHATDSAGMRGSHGLSGEAVPALRAQLGRALSMGESAVTVAELAAPSSQTRQICVRKTRAG